MKRSFAMLALLSMMTALFGCGGGGGGGGGDTPQPAVTGFTMPATATTLAVSVTTLTATNSTGFLITEDSTAPSATAAGWSTSAPTSFTFSSGGSKTAYAWAKNAAGTVSASRPATVTITLSAAAKVVTGVVTDPVSGDPVSGAAVAVFIQIDSLVAKAVAAPVATFTTDANGSYTVTGLMEGTTYYFEVTQTGFATFTYYNIIPVASSDLTLERISILTSDIAGRTATVSGSVKNASTNTGLPTMTVKIRSGVNNQIGAVRATTTTDAAGAYSFANLAAGTYTAEVTGNIGTTPIIKSYFTLVSIPTMTLLNANQDFSVTAPITSGTGTGQFRIVLEWGNDPSDLDSHLTGPTGGNATTATRFHIYYSGSSKSYPLGSTTTDALGNRIAGATTEAFLDVDNTDHGSNNGPETTTIVVPSDGNYKFYVHHFGYNENHATISTSGAQVKVYRGSALLATYNPPSGATGAYGSSSGEVWSVFSMDVTSTGQIITPVNTITTIGTYSLAKVAGDGLERYLLFANLPRK